MIFWPVKQADIPAGFWGDIEEWRPIPEYPAYEASSTGRIRSRGVATILKQRPTSRTIAYPRVCLYRDGEKCYESVHRLVAMAFIPNPENLPQVNHRNLEKTDARVVNLEWVSRRRNAAHAVENGRYSPVSNPRMAFKLTLRDVKELRRRVAAGETGAHVADEMGISRTHASRLVRGLNWKEA